MAFQFTPYFFLLFVEVNDSVIFIHCDATCHRFIVFQSFSSECLVLVVPLDLVFRWGIIFHTFVVGIEWCYQMAAIAIFWCSLSCQASVCEHFPFCLWGKLRLISFLGTLQTILDSYNTCLQLRPVPVSYCYWVYCTSFGFSLGCCWGWLLLTAAIVTFGLSAFFWVIKSWKRLTQAEKYSLSLASDRILVLTWSKEVVLMAAVRYLTIVLLSIPEISMLS